jgi:1-acyl-sn-glycerol-3-phosphate acyltransferase
LIEANKNIVLERMFSVYNKHILKMQFYKIHLKGTNNIINRDKNVPTIMFGNHSNWWDGFLAFYLSFDLWKADQYLMMDVKQMKKYKFFKRTGAFSVNRESARESYESVLYATNLLKSRNTMLWIYPQGEMLPNDIRPLRFQNGLSKLLEMTGNVNLIPIAFNYEFIMEQRPEVFINVSERITVDEKLTKQEKTIYLNKVLTTILDNQKKNIVDGNLEEYEEVLRGKSSRNKIIDRVYND